MADFIEIDGSQGEGGGQVLRTSLTLSAVTGQPVWIEKIRAGREKPGLKRQHLTCVKAVAEICGAKVSEIGVGSSELEFIPGKIKGGDYHFDVGTAGSVTLVAQTVLPVLLKADAPSTVTITGGTHVPFAPIWEFFVETYLPELRRIGARVEAELVACGFYPAAGGVVRLKVWPMDESKVVKSYSLTDLGEYRGGKVVGVVSSIPDSIAEAEVGIVGAQLRELGLERETRRVESFGPGNYCYAQLDYERASIVFSSVGTYEKSRKAVAHDVVHATRNFLKSVKACERHLADQLLVPLEMFVGGYSSYNSGFEWHDNWTLDVQKETLHLTTNRDVISMFGLHE
ncbi:MAG: RNA 3'-phosphate cyclase [Kiritimatiellae bacterium]|nr:RNA 3'-phosphate cyclase [Kiritimatiellia bacterium]